MDILFLHNGPNGGGQNPLSQFQQTALDVFGADMAVVNQDSIHNQKPSDKGRLILAFTPCAFVLADLKAAFPAVPIITVSQHKADTPQASNDHAQYLKAGARDSIPFNVSTEELRQRRDRIKRELYATKKPFARLNTNTFSIDLINGRVFDTRYSSDVREIKLPTQEINALKFIALNHGRLVSRSEVAQAILCKDKVYSDPESTVSSFVSRLTKTLRHCLNDDYGVDIVSKHKTENSRGGFMLCGDVTIETNLTPRQKAQLVPRQP